MDNEIVNWILIGIAAILIIVLAPKCVITFKYKKFIKLLIMDITNLANLSFTVALSKQKEKTKPKGLKAELSIDSDSLLDSSVIVLDNKNALRFSSFNYIRKFKFSKIEAFEYLKAALNAISDKGDFILNNSNIAKYAIDYLEDNIDQYNIKLKDVNQKNNSINEITFVFEVKHK